MKFIKKNIHKIIVIAFISVFVACTKEVYTPAKTDVKTVVNQTTTDTTKVITQASSTVVPSQASSTVSFKTSIDPMLSANCKSCHNSSQASGGVNLSTYANVYSNASSSLSAINNGSMPPNGKLSLASINNLSNWIKQGKLNN